MTDILVFFLAASLLLYILFGGSDFGAGIIELLPAKGLRDKQVKTINHAMGPVWEANHIWLILIVVILFTGFPRIFTVLMISLHIPMLALLIGVVVRGTMFTFRHYDSIQEPVSQRAYTWLFGLSSLWSSIWLGIIAASLNRGLINPKSHDNWEAYFAPWWGWYPLSVGVFVACIFTFLASVFLIGETEDLELRRHFLRRSAISNAFVIFSGGVVFLVSLGEKVSLLTIFLRHPLAIASMLLATVACALLWILVRRGHVYWARVIASGQIVLILLGWWLLYAPNAAVTVQGPLNFYKEAAPTATLIQLVLALLIGSVFIFPSLLFLLKVFKTKGPSF